MIELILGIIVAIFAIWLAVIVIWMIVRVPIALIGSIITERDRKRAAAAKLAQASRSTAP